MIAKAGFVKVRYAGTGFLMIRRQALEKMCAQYPLLQYKRDHSIDAAAASDKRFALFECMIAEDGTYLSEDFAFCKRWTDMGGEIWADLDSKLHHVGPMTFRGDLSSQFAGASPRGDSSSQYINNAAGRGRCWRAAVRRCRRFAAPRPNSPRCPRRRVWPCSSRR